ncbi:hypothetical protein F5X68DRAFT_248447 [Plectosphaerella plurivora]|uniref:Uncharacterized protein n=1 Tax=Plectosphaerella plurivora TaxID=936078 RepID=A0A9P8VKB6_9PEZI|nr:hypothetical protein F5X68DRAFT_248447 [Plectosphaerella plurivora]
MQVARQSGQLTFYSNAWETHCLPSLHPALRRLTHFSTMPSPILDAVLALSACRLSRMTPRKKPFDPNGIPGLSFRPDPDHRTASCERYGSALLSLASWRDITNARGLDVALTGMILLAHLEAMNGDFGQFESHSTAIERLMASLAGSVPRRSTCQLIANWTQARAHNWWRRFHFSTRDFQGSNEPMAVSPWLASVLDTAGDQRAVIMSLLCDCCRLRSVAFLARWDEGSVMDVEDMAFDTPSTTLPRSPAVDLQRAALDRWHRQLPLSELPIERFMNPPGCTSAFEVRPLQFTTHRAAMNYAYYIVARLLLCEFATNDEVPPSSHGAATRQANAWSLLLARIAAGIDWDDCLRLNVFIIGFSTLLIPCALHCSDLRVGLWLQDWLEQRYTPAALEEGSFPILQSLLALRAINRERRDGRDVKAVFVADEDGGGATKYDSYSRQHFRSLWVYGFEKETGRQYSRPLAL